MSDDRVAMRNIERERDGLRDNVRELDHQLAQCRETMRGMHEARACMVAEIDELKGHICESVAERDKLRAEAKAYHEHLAKWEAQKKADAAALAFVRHEDGESHAVSTAELSDFEICAANACGAMRVDADGLGFVKRKWLDRHRASEGAARAKIEAAWAAGPGTTPLSAPAESKAQEWRWTVAQTIGALDGSAEADGNRSLAAMAASHLRETLATLDAVTGLAQRWETWHLGTLVGAEFEAASARCARELREALSGKR